MKQLTSNSQKRSLKPKSKAFEHDYLIECTSPTTINLNIDRIERPFNTLVYNTNVTN